MMAPTASQGVTGNHFRLLDLPSELRNRIYHFVFVAQHPLSLRRHAVYRGRSCTSVDSVKQTKRTTFALLPLLSCCKTTRLEGLPIYYDCNTFGISHPSDLTDFLNLRAIGITRRSLIKHIGMESFDHMNITRARELRRLPSLASVSIMYEPSRDCSDQTTNHSPFVTEAQAKAILNQGVGNGWTDRYLVKLRRGFSSLLDARPNVPCIFITSIDRHDRLESEAKYRADHTFFNISLDETNALKLSATLFKRSSMVSKAGQFRSLCR